MPGTDRIALEQIKPRIGLELLHTEGDLLIILIEAQNNRVDLLTHRNDLRRMFDMLRPAHLGDMDKTFDALFDLDECSVICQRDNFAVDLRADWIPDIDVFPRMRL